MNPESNHSPNHRQIRYAFEKIERPAPVIQLVKDGKPLTPEGARLMREKATAPPKQPTSYDFKPLLWTNKKDLARSRDRQARLRKAEYGMQSRTR